MGGFRRFFWNYKDAFMGMKFFVRAPLMVAPMILTVVLPAQIAMTLQKGRTSMTTLGYYINDQYYDLYDDDVTEK